MITIQQTQKAVEAFYSSAVVNGDVILSSKIWEPCAGHHMISDVLEAQGHIVRKSDLVDYGFGDEELNFITSSEKVDYDIFTNPPYTFAEEFVLKALESVNEGRHVVMFLRTLFLEGQKRYVNIFKDNPPKYVYVFSKRQVCSAKDDFTEGSAVSYAWFVWEKGFKGEPIIRWL